MLKKATQKGFFIESFVIRVSKKVLRSSMSMHMQAEMQRLKEKLAISERTAKAESQLKVTFFFHVSVQIEFLAITNVIW